MIGGFRREGRSVLLSTHNLAEAEELSDRIGILRTRLLAIDAPRALRAAQETHVVRVRAVAWDRETLDRLEGEGQVLEASGEEENVVRFRLEDPTRDRPRLVARLVELGIEILDVGEETRSLEDVYLALVREEEE